MNTIEGELLHIVGTERVRGGVLIAFSDGQEAFYSVELLYSMLNKAEVLNADHLPFPPDESPS